LIAQKYQILTLGVSLESRKNPVVLMSMIQKPG